MFNVDLRIGEKVVLCKAFKTKLQALRFIKTIVNDVCASCSIYVLKRLDNGEYVEDELTDQDIEYIREGDR